MRYVMAGLDPAIWWLGGTRCGGASPRMTQVAKTPALLRERASFTYLSRVRRAVRLRPIASHVTDRFAGLLGEQDREQGLHHIVAATGHGAGATDGDPRHDVDARLLQRLGEAVGDLPAELI